MTSLHNGQPGPATQPHLGSDVLFVLEDDNFSLSVTCTDRTAIMSLVGELDMEHATEVHAGGEVAASVADELIVDVADLQFIDSTGINALVIVRRHAAAHHVPMRLRGTNKRMVDILTIMGLAETFNLV